MWHLVPGLARYICNPSRPHSVIAATNSKSNTRFASTHAKEEKRSASPWHGAQPSGTRFRHFPDIFPPSFYDLHTYPCNDVGTMGPCIIRMGCMGEIEFILLTCRPRPKSSACLHVNHRVIPRVEVEVVETGLVTEHDRGRGLTYGNDVTAYLHDANAIHCAVTSIFPGQALGQLSGCSVMCQSRELQLG